MLASLVKKEQFGLIRAKKKKENGRTKWHCEQSVHGAMWGDLQCILHNESPTRFSFLVNILLWIYCLDFFFFFNLVLKLFLCAIASLLGQIKW